MKKSKHDCDLQSCFFCKGCMPEWLPAIDANRKTFEVKKGEVIFTEGEKVTGIYFVNSGKIKVHKKWDDDKELILRFANQGAIVGHRGLSTFNDIYPVSGTAIEPSRVCFIDIEFFRSSLKVNNDFTFNLMMFFADEFQLSEKKMRNLAHMSVKGRVAQSLLTLQEKFGTTKDGYLDITISRQDLASFSGTTYETVFRILNELTEDKAIQIAEKKILINNINKLKSYTDEQA